MDESKNMDGNYGRGDAGESWFGFYDGTDFALFFLSKQEGRKKEDKKNCKS